MNEITLSNNLSQIELEINHHKQIAGQSIWEIGRRLNHVKENDLAHGQFGEWLNKVDISHREANRMMKIVKELPNSTTWSNLGNRALYLIATLPEEEKQEQIEKIEQGESPTVRELQEVKRRLKLKDQALEAVKGELVRVKQKKSTRKSISMMVRLPKSRALFLAKLGRSQIRTLKNRKHILAITCSHLRKVNLSASCMHD